MSGLHRALSWLLIAHVAIAALAVAFMDTSFATKTADRARDRVIDAYEVLGLGNLALGVLVLTVALGAAWLASRPARAARAK
jgi:hypothetical protein